MSFLKAITCIHTTVRNISKRQFIWYDEGIKYYGFKYYPRNPDTFQDPPYTPTKLFRVERIKPLKGAPYWEKDLLREFHLDGKNNSYVIVKNIPENNQRLWKIKHMLKIVPITFPDGIPGKDDMTVLKENGELRIVKKCLPVDETKIALTQDFKNNVKRLDGDTLRRNSRKIWLTGWQSP